MPAPIKCVVWDLDDTLWKGILLEDERVEPVPDAIAAVKELDRRGILNSIASRNDDDAAMAKLRELEIDEFFLYPQINWGAKHASVAQIARELNIGTDAIAFIEDQPYERDEVAFSVPGVRCYAPEDIPSLLEMPEFVPGRISEESANRRLLYISEQRRRDAESGFEGPQEEFLATLGMVMTIAPVGDDDLARAEELTVRTNQLNTTGRTYGIDDLDRMRRSPDHLVLMASLQDRYGSYGKIGLAVVKIAGGDWVLKLLLMSCRVMARGVGSVMLNHVMRLASDAGASLTAELVPNDRNRMMLVTLRFSGFEEVGRDGEMVLFRSTRPEVPPPPDYLELHTADVTPPARANPPAPSASGG